MTAYLLGLGFVLGLKHALDADHLVAVTTIVSERRSLFSSSLVGLTWGIGHTSTLLLAGIAVLAIDMTIPAAVSQSIEFAVALVLIVMGLNVLMKLIRGGKVHDHPHRHGDYLHSHPHVHDQGGDARPGHANSAHPHSSAPGLQTRQGGLASLFLGMLHGLAGSAGLMLLVAATISEFWVGVGYITVFGIGSIGGMWVMSMLISLPFLLTEGRFHQMNKVVRAVAGIASIAVGARMGWDIGIVGGLLG